MKKIVEIDDELYEKLEKIKKDYHIKTISPVISLILTLGVKWFEKLNDISPTINVPTPIPWPIPYDPYVPSTPWGPYEPTWIWPKTTDGKPWGYEVWCDGSCICVTGFGDYKIGDWNISAYTTGASISYVG